MRNVTRDRRVFVFFELTERHRAHELLDQGLYPQAIRGTQLLAAADAPHVPLYWAASTVERREFGPAVPAFIAVYCEGYDDVTPVTRVRYRDEAQTQAAAGYCMTQEHNGSAWVDFQDPWAWLASLGLVRYQSPFEPDELDTNEEAARAAARTMTQAEVDGITAALDVALGAAYSATGQTPSGLRDALGVGAANARFLVSDQ